MEDSETKSCPNCKREIPCVNFTIHSVHCARNIRMCPVCKEPVPQNELQEHHDKLHKLLPCEKCGESVCGTDMEDHIRDSCAHTIKTCRFCELELPRRDLPAHENYCGVRTEQCPDCREWVMIKYRQLHLDSNHGFIRLDEDPVPHEVPRCNLTRPVLHNINSPFLIRHRPTTSRDRRDNGFVKRTNEQPRARLLIGVPPIFFEGPSTSGFFSGAQGEGSSNDQRASSQNGAKPPTKRTNDQPQINTNVPPLKQVEKNLGVSRGAVKKRPAPRPPSADPRRDLAYHSAMQRQQEENRARQEEIAPILSVALPPASGSAGNLEKVRKMDPPQNPDSEMEYITRPQSRGNRSPEQASTSRAGNVLGSDDMETRRQDFKNWKPMTPEQFIERFSDMELRAEGQADRKESEADRKKSADRFSEIKSSLRELRRGLNEVTAPYNSNLNSSNNNNSDRAPDPVVQDPNAQDPNAQDEVQLPCEFCGALIPARDLVQHQTGCRPDLAQLLPRAEGGQAAAAEGARSRSPASRRNSYEDPVIPCEFCAESLPVYLISEHQERCGREANLLFAD